MQSKTQLSFFKQDQKSNFQKPPSLVKWSGSKRGLAQQIISNFPSFDRYFEPFLGGGSILYNVAAANIECFGGDIYTPLIELWSLVKEKPEMLLAEYTKDWEALQENFPEYYYIVRERFNKKPNGQDLLFLSRTCVNGIIRFNTKGEFNNSLHVSRRGMTPKNFARVVSQWNPIVASVSFKCGDYSDLLTDAKKGDFVYLDPPYLGSKNRYLNNLDADALLVNLDNLNSRGVKWALSFDGTRGDVVYGELIPHEMYKSKIPIAAGHSAVNKVLNQSNQNVVEALYINY